jgi:hypothetical protein
MFQVLLICLASIIHVQPELGGDYIYTEMKLCCEYSRLIKNRNQPRLVCLM